MSPLFEASHGWFRTWFRKVWEVRGGGLYALGFIATFIVLEVRSLADDVHVVQLAPPWGAIALGAAYFGFSTYLKKPIEGWLFDDEPESIGEPAKEREA